MSAVFVVFLWFASGTVVTVSVYVPTVRLDTVITLPSISTTALVSFTVALIPVAPVNVVFDVPFLP